MLFAICGCRHSLLENLSIWRQLRVQHIVLDTDAVRDDMQAAMMVSLAKTRRRRLGRVLIGQLMHDLVATTRDSPN